MLTLDRRDPMRIRIDARNPFISIDMPTTGLRFYPAAPVAPVQEKTGSEIGFTARLGDADSTKIMGVHWGGSGMLQCLRKHAPVAASEEFVKGSNLTRRIMGDYAIVTA